MKDYMFILFGATGDLTKKKLIPALYNLYTKGKLDTPVICVSRRDITKGEYIRLLELNKYIKNLNKKKLSGFLKLIYYIKLDFENKDPSNFTSAIKQINKQCRCSGNIIFYLALSPSLFKKAVDVIKSSSLLEEKGFKRIVFEKPFGNDLRSAKEINKHIKKTFKEDQIYRIDHFLGKELVQNISVLRFTNTLFEPQWNNKFIDHIQIVLSENFGIKDRGPFYDKYGAIKDVIQNHMLQLLALTAMEPPKKLTSNNIRNEKVKILKRIQRIKQENIILGQYSGYKKEKGVNKNSDTETFAALKLFIKNPRWKNIPFYLITGKNMKNNLVAIHIQFRKPKCLLFNNVCDFEGDHLTIEIQPEEGFHAHINAKVPGKTEIKPVKMDFCHECTFGPNSPEAYENLLLDVAKGDQSAFIRTDEIEESWKITDPITDKKLKVYSYKKGSYPKEADKLIQKDNREWNLTRD